MAVMNDAQNELLDLLYGAREIYEAFEKELTYEVANRKWEAKTDIRRLVREAVAAGVPYRQIGKALKTADHRTLKEYENDVRR